jgi:L-lactate utilization protein LutC
MYEIINNTIQALKKNHIEAQYFESTESLIDCLLNTIKKEEVVGIGGSVTIEGLGIAEKLIRRGNKVDWHWLETTDEGRYEARRKQMSSDVYLTSTNALTMHGQLVNIDGTGNRVASMIFGPKKVIVVCGVNKIVPNLEAAMERVKEASVLNAKRLKLNTPCTVKGECFECTSQQRICNVTTIIEKRPSETEMIVMIVNENLGY